MLGNYVQSYLFECALWGKRRGQRMGGLDGMPVKKNGLLRIIINLKFKQWLDGRVNYHPE